jgi:hypothetical protein
MKINMMTAVAASTSPAPVQVTRPRSESLPVVSAALWWTGGRHSASRSFLRGTSAHALGSVMANTCAGAYPVAHAGLGADRRNVVTTAPIAKANRGAAKQARLPRGVPR